MTTPGSSRNKMWIVALCCAAMVLGAAYVVSGRSAPATFESITADVQTFVDERDLDGLSFIIVERDTGIVYEEHFGSFDAERVSMVASSSKMISAGVLLRLQEQGLLEMDTPIDDQLDWAIGNSEITPAQLLSNSSGLVGLGPDLRYAPYECQWSDDTPLQGCGEAVLASEGDDADQISPDTEFRYGGAQWQVAGALAEAVSGKSWNQLIDEIYVEPCGVKSLGYVSLATLISDDFAYPAAFAGDPTNVPDSANPNVEAGAHITARDYARLLLMHLNGGRCGDQSVLSQASLDTMHADRIASYGGSTPAGNGYGMGWWVDRKSERIRDSGAWGAYAWLDLDDGYGVYFVMEDSFRTGQELRLKLEEDVHSVMTG